ncbi:hypothetical protein B0H65DRAFT_551234 [Neurospora tetraspora]|uniref:Uncharacterized protein n=1 Tax=Neurospora tetraspora TaxID=94610 RepID=A0AAE0JB94_9PEZI|nr:hypothetical protein B0H65DRAFT_551234 [Neurospora tetraspora]
MASLVEISPIAEFTSVLATLPSASSEVTQVVTGVRVSTNEILDAIKNNPVNGTATVASRGLDKRASLGVYLCRDAPFVDGTCEHIFGNPGDFSMCDSTCPSNNNENGCRQLDSSYPSRSNLNTAANNVCGVNSNDKIRSYRCRNA